MNETKYIIEYKKNLNQEELASFMMLYAPLLSPLAAELYLLLMSVMFTTTKIRNHRFLCESLHCSLMELNAARMQLEQLLLVKTYENKEKNILLMELENPKCGNDFLSHEVLGRYYLKVMGSKMHQFVTVSFAHIHSDKSDFTEITAPFKAECLSSWNESEERQYQKYIETQPKDAMTFDMDVFLKNCTELVFPNVARNKEACEMIAKLGTLYHISITDMIAFVGRSIDLKTKKLKINTLRKIILDAYQPLHHESNNRYAMRPYDFLYELQNHIKPSSADAKILEDLSTVYKLPFEVINVLIEYVLSVNNQKLDRSYIEKIAALWVRRNVDTYEKALEQCQSPKEMKQKKTAGRKIPEWYNEKETEVQKASEKDIEELNALLEKMR